MNQEVEKLRFFLINAYFSVVCVFGDRKVSRYGDEAEREVELSIFDAVPSNSFCKPCEVEHKGNFTYSYCSPSATHSQFEWRAQQTSHRLRFSWENYREVAHPQFRNFGTTCSYINEQPFVFVHDQQKIHCVPL